MGDTGRVEMGRAARAQTHPAGVPVHIDPEISTVKPVEVPALADLEQLSQKEQIRVICAALATHQPALESAYEQRKDGERIRTLEKDFARQSELISSHLLPESKSTTGQLLGALQQIAALAAQTEGLWQRDWPRVETSIKGLTLALTATEASQVRLLVAIDALEKRVSGVAEGHAALTVRVVALEKIHNDSAVEGKLKAKWWAWTRGGFVIAAGIVSALSSQIGKLVELFR